MTHKPALPAGRVGSILAVLGVSLAIPVAALALPDVGDEQDGLLDTPRTPRAQPSDPEGRKPWTYASGAKFSPNKRPDPGFPDGSMTPTEVDFLDVAVEDDSRAFAVGSADVGGGRRVPVIYGYRKNAFGDESWTEVYRSPDDRPGYAARVVWADPKTVLVVGGDGTFPDREKLDGSGYCNEGDPGEQDSAENGGAGEGRVWVLREGEPWRELTAAEKPADLRALTALDSWYAANPEAKLSFAVAGGLCQLWHFRDGEFLRNEDGTFAEPHDTESVEREATPPFDPDRIGDWLVVERQAEARPHFRLRVRDIAFADTAHVIASERLIRVAAVTSGCCVPGAESPLTNPLMLEYSLPSGDADPARGKWTVMRESLERTISPSGADPLVLPDSGYALGFAQTTPTAASPTQLPDHALYQLLSTGREEATGAAADTEPPSVWTLPRNNRGGEFPLLHKLSSMRLVDEGGNADAATGSAEARLPDWTVGTLRSTGQGVALGTNVAQLPPPSPALTNPLPCPTTSPTECAGKPWEPTSVEKIQSTQRSWQLLKLPIYGAAGVDILDEEGMGWAVGRYGGIARFDDGRGGAAPPGSGQSEAPAVGAAVPASFPGEGLYDDFRAFPSERKGEVPPLGRQPFEQLARPRLTPAAAPGEVSHIVMSEDGSEGWAVTTANARTEWAHFRDGEWRPCYSQSVGDGRFPSNPACSALAAGSVSGLGRLPSSEGFVPYAIAGGSIFVAEDGVWAPYRHAMPSGLPIAMLAFTSVDQGWALRRPPHSVGGNGQELWRYDAASEGPKWKNCTDTVSLPTTVRRLAINCGDTEGRLDFKFVYPLVGNLPLGEGIASTQGGLPTPAIVGMRAAAGRLYMYGARIDPDGFSYPFIVAFDGERWTVEPEDGGLDPACARLENRTCTPPTEADQDDFGEVTGLAVDDVDGQLRGWAFGAFGSERPRPARVDTWASQLKGTAPNAITTVARFMGDGWRAISDKGVLRDYLASGSEARAVSLGGENAVLPRASRLVRFNSARDRFELVEAGRRPFATIGAQPQGDITAIGPAKASAWIGVKPGHLFHYTDRPRKELFTEAPNPLRNAVATSAASAPDGSLWLATRSDRLYRHDRLYGWENVRIAGWNAGDVITAQARAHAIAVGDDGTGLVVGDGGRIARIDGMSVELDRAVAKVCDLKDPQPPCGTGKRLVAAAVAPDGAGMVAGERRALLWRPAGGDFRTIPTPAVSGGTTLTGVALPASDRAWVTTADGRIFAGSYDGSTWIWAEEARDAQRRRVAMDRSLTPVRHNAIAARADGTAIAVGGRGVILERSAAGIWERADSGVIVDLVSVAANGHGGALVGGEGGLVLTRVGGTWRLARASRFPGGGNGASEGQTRGVSLSDAPDGQGVEAWAVVENANGSGSRVWHHTDSSDPMVDLEARVKPLPDSPPRRPGELSLAAWGKTECTQRAEWTAPCGDINLTESYYETLGRRIRDAIVRAKLDGEIDAAVFTGDAVDNATHQGNHAVGEPVRPPVPFAQPFNGRRKMTRWREVVADPLEDAGVPFLVGIGGQDLAANQVCDAVNCTSASRFAHVGENFVWRSVLDGRLGAGPGGPEAVAGSELRFRELHDSGASPRLEDTSVPNSEEPLPTGGGADTHFAIEAEDVATGAPTTRIVFVDTSMRSLASSDPLQQPAEPRGGQAMWLERMLCFAPGTSPDGQPCTRRPGQGAVVVTNTPTYTYRAGGLATQPDGAAFEALVMKHRVTAVVTGRLGWNGLYWTLAPGLHTPCPGGDYPAGPPDADDPCGDKNPIGLPVPGAEPLAGVVGGTAAPPPGSPVPGTPQAPRDLEGAANSVSERSGPPVPFVVASGGGGKFASEADADASASLGFWHGYTVVRIASSGHPAETLVEQRPVYDFVTVEAQERRLRPGQRMTLRGWGRGPVGYSEQQAVYTSRWDRIDGPAVTHRYDLVLADREKPYLPAEDAGGDYVPVPRHIATVDRQSGLVRAGRGTGERTYAIGLLSVGDHVASYPLAFEPRRSFTAQRAKITLPPAPRPARAPPAAQAPVRLADPPPPPAAPPAQPAAPIGAQTLQPPQPPSVPSLPAAHAPATPQAPAPPSLAPPPAAPLPPNVPPQQQPQPLALGGKLQPVAIVPSVNPPAPPPVNPAPPAGSAARKEAKQRQAATAKSEEAAGQGPEAGAEMSDALDSRTEPMTRHQEPLAFSRLDRGNTAPASWQPGVLYGGALTLAALLLATANGLRRSAPGRRPPRPAPAESLVARRR